MTMINVGIMLFAAAVLFYIVTLPVEFNASRRALKVLGQTGILAADELPYARKVLSAAALTLRCGDVGSARKPVASHVNGTLATPLIASAFMQ